MGPGELVSGCKDDGGRLQLRAIGHDNAALWRGDETYRLGLNPVEHAFPGAALGGFFEEVAEGCARREHILDAAARLSESFVKLVSAPICSKPIAERWLRPALQSARRNIEHVTSSEFAVS